MLFRVWLNPCKSNVESASTPLTVRSTLDDEVPIGNALFAPSCSTPPAMYVVPYVVSAPGYVLFVLEMIVVKGPGSGVPATHVVEGTLAFGEMTNCPAPGIAPDSVTVPVPEPVMVR